VADTPADTSIDPAERAVNASASGPATNSTIALGATRRSCSAAPFADRTADSASAPSDTICAAMVSSLLPPAVIAIPPPLRVSRGSSRYLRSAASAWETAGSLTPSALAAAFTDPSRATSTKALSCVNVMRRL
jgi:hypothetical protein